jgi:hypothetical protein
MCRASRKPTKLNAECRVHIISAQWISIVLSHQCKEMKMTHAPPCRGIQDVHSLVTPSPSQSSATRQSLQKMGTIVSLFQSCIQAAGRRFQYITYSQTHQLCSQHLTAIARHQLLYSEIRFNEVLGAQRSCCNELLF